MSILNRHVAYFVFKNQNYKTEKSAKTNNVQMVQMYHSKYKFLIMLFYVCNAKVHYKNYLLKKIEI